MRVPLQVGGPEKTRRRASRTAAPPASGTERRTVQLAVTAVRPWTVLRIWIVIGTLFFVIVLAALVIVYTMLSATGALASIERAVNSGGIELTVSARSAPQDAARSENGQAKRTAA